MSSTRPSIAGIVGRAVLSFSGLLVGSLLVSECAGQVPAPTMTLEAERPTDTSLPPPPVWREASEPITLDNITGLERLGVLNVPEGSGTVFGFALSPDNTQLAALNESWLLAWDLVTGEALYRTTRQDEIQLYYAPDKDTLYGLTASGGIYFYDSATGSEIDARPAPITFSQAGFSGAYAYHHDSAALALGLEDGDIIVWDLIAGEAGEAPQRLVRSGAASPVLDLNFSQEGETLAAVYGTEQGNRLSLWRWRDGTRLLDAAPLPSDQAETISEITLSPDGRFLAGMALETGFIWEAQTGELLHTLPTGLAGGSLLFRFIPDTALLVTGGIGSDLLLWDVERGAVIATLPETGGDPDSIAPIGAAVSPDSQMLFTAKLDQPVALWNLANLESGNIARSAQPFGSPSIFDVLWTDDSFAVLMVDARGPVEVWGIP